ncbi:MAG: isochorismate synthase [Actinomycetota bacterium]
MGIDVTTVAIDDPGDLLTEVPEPEALVWLRHGDGLVARGEAVAIKVGTGPERVDAAARELQALFGSMNVRDEVGVRGSGPVAFGAISFDPDIGGSVLIVPEVVVGRRNGLAWRTTIGQPSERPTPAGVGADSDGPDRVRYWGSSVPEMTWLEAVAKAEAAVGRGDLEKVVLARDVRVWSRSPLRPHRLLRKLSGRFPECYSFSIDGLIGATPELLVRRDGLEIESLVLAGSAARGPDAESDDRFGRDLLNSTKDEREHEVALRSVVEVLRPICPDVDIAEPELLKLANVQHIATRVAGKLESSRSALELAGLLHPTAAVCGLPRDDALEMIRALEGMDRARYSGPVGWVDARGNGEWGIALRCAELSSQGARLFAGSGIVEGSRPEAELEETRLKLRAMQSALES